MRMLPFKDRLRRKVGPKPNPLSVVILSVALIAVFPLAYALGRSTDIGWLYSALGAVAIAAGLGGSALQLIDK